MFERYTERARRVIFMARIEASQFGSRTIEPEHMLLGLLREDPNFINRFKGEGSVQAIRDELAGGLPVLERTDMAKDLPLSAESKWILAHAAEEAERLNHRHIGTEHLLLAMLRIEKSAAAQTLRNHGIQLEAAREHLRQGPVVDDTTGRRPLIAQVKHGILNVLPAAGYPESNLPKGGVVPDAETAKRIAEAIWIPMFGEETVAAQKPFNAELKFTTWIVNGSGDPEKALFAFILRADARVLSVGRGDGKWRKDSGS